MRVRRVTTAEIGTRKKKKPPDTILCRRLDDSEAGNNRGGGSPAGCLRVQTSIDDRLDCASCRRRHLPGHTPIAQNDDSHSSVRSDYHRYRLFRQQASPAASCSANADQALRRAYYCPGPIAAAMALKDVVQDSLLFQKTGTYPQLVLISCDENWPTPDCTGTLE